MNLEQYEEELINLPAPLTPDEAFNAVARKEIMKHISNYEYCCYDLGTLKFHLTNMTIEGTIKEWTFWHLDWSLDITYMNGFKENIFCGSTNPTWENEK